MHRLPHLVLGKADLGGVFVVEHVAADRHRLARSSEDAAQVRRAIPCCSRSRRRNRPSEGRFWRSSHTWRHKETRPRRADSGALRFAVLSGGFGRRGLGRGGRMEFAPALTARSQRDHRARWRRPRLPSGDGPDVRQRLRVVGDPRKSPAQLDSSRQLTLLAEDGADRVGVGLGDEEHPQSMGTRRSSDKRGVVSYLARPSENRWAAGVNR
jgi:hypothetical protein